MTVSDKLRGFTLVETLLALSILALAMLAYYSTLSRALLLSETNKQVKMALNDAQSIIEEIAGAPFDEIMDPDYPTPELPAPRFRHMQPVDNTHLFGINPDATPPAPNPPHLDSEVVTVTYSQQTAGGLLQVLPIVPGSDSTDRTKYPLVPDATHPVEYCRPANNTPDEFQTPEPLYVTVRVTWAGPVVAYNADGSRVLTSVQLTYVRNR